MAQSPVSGPRRTQICLLHDHVRRADLDDGAHPLRVGYEVRQSHARTLTGPDRHHHIRGSNSKPASDPRDEGLHGLDRGVDDLQGHIGAPTRCRASRTEPCTDTSRRFRNRISSRNHQLLNVPLKNL